MDMCDEIRAELNADDELDNSADGNDKILLNENDDSSSSNLYCLPEDVLEEEQRAKEKREQEDSTVGMQPTDLPRQLQDEEKEKNYKCLLNLLSKSNQYANFILRKLDNYKENKMVEQPTEELNKTEGKKRTISVNLDRNPKRCKTACENETYINANGLEVSIRQPELFTGGIMRDYQLDGLDWLKALYENGINGILADEMGLGKTIQVIALICHLFSRKAYGPFLVIGPLSTLSNWLIEFTNFAPSVTRILYHGEEKKRRPLRKRILDDLRKNNVQMPVVITSYEIALRDKGFFKSIEWRYIFVDEGHRIKNHKSMISQALKTYKTHNKLLLTGTPLQNNLTELWSLLHFLLPEIFQNLQLFESLFDFSNLGDEENQTRLIKEEQEHRIISIIHGILNPFLLRRMKSDVKMFLPKKKEVLVYAPLSDIQERLYKAALDGSIEKYMKTPETEISGKRGEIKRNENKENLLSIEDDNVAYNIQIRNIGMLLRKIANHPYLIEMPVIPGTRDIILDERLVTKCGKLLVLDAMLPQLKKNQHKILLFSTFTVVLDLLEEYMEMRSYRYLRLDGSNKIDERAKAISEFNKNPDIFIFLISTRAGGLGINLTAADTVIIYDSDWNPQVDLQAQDRCHRIGQLKPVVVYRIITTGTVDERILKCADGKRKLEQLVMSNKTLNKKEKFDNSISINELLELFNSKDNKKVIHQNGTVFTDEELNELLDRSDLIETGLDNGVVQS